jgi:uncharacterized membrane protein
LKLGGQAEMIKKEFLGQMMLIFGIVMVILIIILGIYILIAPSLDYWPVYFRTIFALFIIAYGIYRSLNIFQKYKNREDKQ